MKPVFVPDLEDEPLDKLELRIAQRADELARVRPSGHSAKRDRETWLRAESEIFTGFDPHLVDSR